MMSIKSLQMFDKMRGPYQKSYQLSSDTVYSQDYILDLKGKLESRYGGKMKIINTLNQLFLKCDEGSYRLDDCRFCYKFSRKWDVQSKDCGFQFKASTTKHSVYCKLLDQQYCFDKNKDLILTSKNFIADILIQRYQIYGPQNPKAILDAVSLQFEAEQTNNSFIYKGLTSTSSKRKIKKKFDNLIAQIRKQNNLEATRKANSKNPKKRRTNFSQLSLKGKNSESDNQNDIKYEQEYSQIQGEQESEFIPCISTVKKINQNIKNLIIKNCSIFSEITDSHAKDQCKIDKNSQEQVKFEEKSIFKTKSIKKSKKITQQM